MPPTPRSSTDSQADIEARVRARTAEIGEALARDSVPLSTAMQSELLQRLPELPADQIVADLLAVSVASNLESVSHLLRGHVEDDDLQVPDTAHEYARRLAQRDVPVSALLRAYQLGQLGVLRWAFDQLDALEPDPGIARDASRSITLLTFAYVDRITAGVIDTYQAERDRWVATRNADKLRLVQSLLDGEEPDRTATETGLGYRLGQLHLAVVAWPAPGQKAAPVPDLGRLLGKVAKHLGASTAPLFVSRDRDHGWAWLPLGPAAGEVDLAELDALVAERDTVRLAFGTPARGVDGFRASHSEALKAHRVALLGSDGPRVISYDQPGVRAATLLTDDLDATRRLVARTLGSLAADNDNAARLRDTLLSFLHHNESYKATAEQVHLHKNTVKYRVDKAAEARGKPVTEDRLDLELALLACQWLPAAVLRPEGRSTDS